MTGRRRGSFNHIMDETLRAADRDRDRVAEVLREHYAVGRLTMEEFDERSTAAAKAKTLGDLRVLTSDLPALSEPHEAAWSPKTMRRITAAGLAAAAVVVGIAMVFGHFVLAVPTWLAILVAFKLLHGRRRFPSAGRPRPRRG
jgi:uncharacterized protein DUF1707